MRGFTRRQWLLTAGAGAATWTAGPAWVGAVEDEGMVSIPAGPFLMGTTEGEAARLAREYGHHVSWLSGEGPQRTVELAAYRIDRYPVTNRRFSAFCKAAGYAARPHWQGPEPPEHLLDHPVVFVDKADAEAYAQWAGKRLPTEAQWEKAARGTAGRLFPWGNEFVPEACQWDPGGDVRQLGTAPVTAHPRGASPYGVMDLAGNAAEWCADGPGPGSAFIKGGCWMTTQPINLRPAARNMSGFANNASAFYGFRCVKEVG